MYKDILRSIAGIEVYPVISLIVFVTFFTAVLVWAGRMSRGQIDHLSHLPLDESASSTGEARR
jgi:cytochrome c oxidase cbb3-type subunit IV